MEPRYPRSAWYDQTLTPPPPPPPPPRKRGQGWIIALVTVLVVAIVVSGVLGVRLVRSRWVISTARDRQSTVPPTATPKTDYGDDFRRFFEDYYASAEPEEHFSGSSLERTQGDESAKLEIVSSLGRKELTLQALHRQSVNSIVGIQAYHGDDYRYFWGSGIIMSADGYVVTNEHIIDEAERAVVVLPDGREYEALLVGEDTLTDIALLKIDASGLTPAEFGDSAELSVGDPVAAIGNPLGDSLTGTMTTGIVSAIDRDIQMNGRRMSLIQTDAAINEGNSGGALLNMYGQVVGITNMKMVNHYSDIIIEGIGFAIPSATIKTVTDELITRGKVTGRPGLGITVGPIPAGAAERYGLPEGLYITAVSEGSDAKAQGIRPGDILTHVNGHAVSSTGDVLAERDSSFVGDAMTLTIWRDGRSFDVEIVLRELSTLY